jgi:hypothetical protein
MADLSRFGAHVCGMLCEGEEWGYHMYIMRCGVRAAIVCDVQLIGRLSLVVVPCVAAVGAATPL